MCSEKDAEQSDDMILSCLFKLRVFFVVKPSLAEQDTS